MKKISSILKKQEASDGFPLIGCNGYAGEQDGDRALLSGPFFFPSKKEADQEFENGVPEYVELHWCRFRGGWEVVFGWWEKDALGSDEENPLIAL